MRKSRKAERAPRPRTLVLRPFTNHVINPVARLFVHRVPGFALISHRGRRSGDLHRTPMKFFREGQNYVFALTYGSDAHWVKNILAAGAAELRIGDRTIHLGHPQVFIDRRRSLMPGPVRVFLSVLRVTEFLRMRPARSP
jgi:deazaflavin-dependent oxidoreductase (nitroreductase family)